MAHPYAIDSRERETIPLYLAGAAVASAIALGWVLKIMNWSVPAWVDAPSTAAFYGLYYQMFRVWFWRWALLRRLCVVTIPNLGGKWEGHVVTTYDECSGRHDVRVSIQQNWTHMTLCLRSTYSQSRSIIGGITIEDGPVLSYEYLNEPLAAAVGTMHAHRGSARMRLSEDGNVLEGDYFTGRDRTNYGSILLKRTPSGSGSA